MHYNIMNPILPKTFFIHNITPDAIVSTPTGFSFALFVIVSIFISLCCAIMFIFFSGSNKKEAASNEDKKKQLWRERLLQRSSDNPVLLFCFLAIAILSIWFIYSLVFINAFPNANEFGDSYGALNTLFSGFAFVGILITILLQNYALNEQRKEIKSQHVENVIQANIARRSRFENTFFNMLEAHRNITEQLIFTDANIKYNGKNTFKEVYKYKAFDKPINHTGTIFATEGACRQYIIHRLATVRNQYIGKPEGIDNIHIFDSYFRYLYRILKFIDINMEPDQNPNSDNPEQPCSLHEKKMEYCGLLRAQLSSYELALLFYNSLVPEYWKMKSYISRYRLFDSLRLELLPAPVDMFLYEPCAFGHNKLLLIHSFSKHSQFSEYFGINSNTTIGEDEKKFANRQRFMKDIYMAWINGHVYFDEEYEGKMTDRANFRYASYRSIQNCNPFKK